MNKNSCLQNNGSLAPYYASDAPCGPSPRKFPVRPPFEAVTAPRAGPNRD